MSEKGILRVVIMIEVQRARIENQTKKNKKLSLTFARILFHSKERFETFGVNWCRPNVQPVQQSTHCVR